MNDEMNEKTLGIKATKLCNYLNKHSGGKVSFRIKSDFEQKHYMIVVSQNDYAYQSRILCTFTALKNFDYLELILMIWNSLKKGHKK